MSCSFWLRRKKKNAMLQERAKAEATVSKTEIVKEETIPETETPKKPTKKAVKKNDNEATV